MVQTPGVCLDDRAQISKTREVGADGPAAHDLQRSAIKHGVVDLRIVDAVAAPGAGRRLSVDSTNLLLEADPVYNSTPTGGISPAASACAARVAGRTNCTRLRPDTALAIAAGTEPTEDTAVPAAIIANAKTTTVTRTDALPFIASTLSVVKVPVPGKAAESPHRMAPILGVKASPRPVGVSVRVGGGTVTQRGAAHQKLLREL